MGLTDLLKNDDVKNLLDKGLDMLKDNITEETIEKLIETCKKKGLTENETVEKLMDQFNISASDAEKYLKKYVKKLLK